MWLTLPGWYGCKFRSRTCPVTSLQWITEFTCLHEASRTFVLTWVTSEIRLAESTAQSPGHHGAIIDGCHCWRATRARSPATRAAVSLNRTACPVRRLSAGACCRSRCMWQCQAKYCQRCKGCQYPPLTLKMGAAPPYSPLKSSPRTDCTFSVHVHAMSNLNSCRKVYSSVCLPISWADRTLVTVGVAVICLG
jgi:hypothetical protein